MFDMRISVMEVSLIMNVILITSQYQSHRLLGLIVLGIGMFDVLNTVIVLAIGYRLIDVSTGLVEMELRQIALGFLVCDDKVGVALDARVS